MNDSTGNIYDQLESLANNPPKLWAPDGIPEGQDADASVTDALIFGLVEQVEMRESIYEPYPFLMLRRRDDSRISVHGFGTVLTKRLASIEAGDGVLIEYLGKQSSREREGAEYANYRVEVMRQKRSSSLAAVETIHGDDDPAQWPEEVSG